ncbi:fumarylacetoacetate hydrolase family protein [Neobacillus ginsengisoli]|uniref:2-dehydro-3-deoxy-D-arabinonate dehydratase n=1 Tax=Neobacillus ginsengisoli TaxID=904295 RepID=A0ABT9XUX1_9BACI|nr:fumarylacetoacetate hydrolase family protein [Neobacillus ginsengisoli]MDQ0199355.1 2-dehydro-3-deoxy-D-arabinonate dehydratase [Neobacillus ginsengisoli]
MRIICVKQEEKSIQLAVLTDSAQIYLLQYKSFLEMMKEAEIKNETCLSLVQQAIQDSLPIEAKLEDLTLTLPIQPEEVWAAGVTYIKSRDARNLESKATGESFYDKVYESKRPELFIKSTLHRTVGPDEPVYIRTDSSWQIPEPELGLVLSSKGDIVGYTIGNDMSSRDIEGENPLYLPQAKIWKHSCSIGPSIRLAETVEDAYNLDITCRIYRNAEMVFKGQANTSQLKRKYDELVSYLLRDNVVFDGTVLLTGTCIVPDEDFTLADGDVIEIEISGIGVLRNPVQIEKNYSLLN